MKEYYNKMNIIKFLCAIAVVMIHLTDFMVTQGKATAYNYYCWRPFLEIAVPFFFACSGFLIAKRQVDYLKKYTVKTFSVFMAFSMFYILIKFVFVFTDRIFLGTPFWNGVKNVFNTLTISTFIRGTFGQSHLWYLMAMVIAMLLLICLLYFKINETTILLISTILYLVYLSGWINFEAVAVWGGFPKAFFYVTLGYNIGYMHFPDVEKPLISFVLCMIAFTVYNMFSKSNLSQLLLAFSTYFLMVYVSTHKGKDSFLSRMGKKYSLNIYILHIFVYQVFYRILMYKGIDIEAFRYNPFNILGLLVISVFFRYYCISRFINSLFARLK